jgi:hypothetical protein
VCWKPCSSCWSFHLLREEFLSAPIHSPPLWFAVSVLQAAAHPLRSSDGFDCGILELLPPTRPGALLPRRDLELRGSECGGSGLKGGGSEEIRCRWDSTAAERGDPAPSASSAPGSRRWTSTAAEQGDGPSLPLSTLGHIPSLCFFSQVVSVVVVVVVVGGGGRWRCCC